MAESVRITDVAPRDGLQNESIPIATARKAGLVRKLIAANADEIEVTSFVSPRWIPQLGDAAELLAMLAGDARGDVVLSALVPNEKGLDGLETANEQALAEHGRPIIDKASVFTAASETFSKKNTNASIDQTLERFKPVAQRCGDRGMPVRGYVSCVVACPYEGPIEPHAVARIAAELAHLGIGEIDLGDTIGAGTPESIGAVIAETRGALAAAGHGSLPITLHLHDTIGLAGACVRAALDLGIRSFDASTGGLGGCPYASTPDQRAPGNIATQTLVAVAEQAGFVTRIDHAALAEAARYAGLLALGAAASEEGLA